MSLSVNEAAESFSSPPDPEPPKPGRCPDGHEVCEACGECHECEEVAERALRKAQEPQTQKALGLRVLQRCGWQAPASQIIKTEETIKPAFTKVAAGNREALGKKPLFARPCPIRPRHGFVESRAVRSEAEIRRVFEEARAADPEAELILSPMIESSHNMLWRPGLLAVGPAHDGATAGKKSIGIPLLRLAWEETMGSMTADAKVGEEEDPYIEAVFNREGSTTFFTQLRAGVRVPEGVGKDFVPRRFRVKRIVEIDPTKASTDDLLQWEETVKTLKDEEGVVVYHEGGTLGSHYAVHCMQKGIQVPYVTTKRPTIGKWLEQQAPPSFDANQMRRGIAAGTIVPMEDSRREHYVCSVLTGLHHSAALRGDDSFYVGVAAALMVRLGYAAAIGESRHSGKSPIFLGGPFAGGLSRSQIYEKALSGSIFAARKLVPAVLKLFFTKGAWGSAYGGPKWGACTKATIQLDNAIVAFVKDPSAEKLDAFVAALNNAVNQAHNNGWWLNKFAATGLFNKAVKGDPRAIIPAGVAFFDARQLTDTQLAVALTEWQAVEVMASSPTATVIDGEEIDVAFEAAKKVTPVVTHAQCVIRDGTICHIQYVVKGGVGSDGMLFDVTPYKTFDTHISVDAIKAIKEGEVVPSLAGSETSYWTLKVKQTGKKIAFYAADGTLVATTQLSVWEA